LINPDRAAGDFLADTPAPHENAAARAEGEGFHHVIAATRLHRLRPRLQNEQLARHSVLGPFDVEGRRLSALRRVVFLDPARPPRERQDIVVAHRKARAIAGGHRNVLHHLPSTQIEDELELLCSDPFLENWLRSRLERRLEHAVLVGRDRSLYHIFAEAVGRIDQHDVPEARLGIEREHHARGAEVRTNHALHSNRQRDLRVIESLVDAVRDRPILEQGGKTALARIEQRVPALHVQVGFLLTGEAGIRQVFRRRAAPDRDRNVLDRRIVQLRVGTGDLRHEIGRKLRREDGMPDVGAAAPQVVNVAHVEPGQLRLDRSLEPRLPQERAEGIRRHGKPRRHVDPVRRKLPKQLAQ
jgi:hypothetical protein